MLRLSRREFARCAGFAAAARTFRSKQEPGQGAPQVPVVVVRGRDAAAAVPAVFERVGSLELEGKDVYLKGSYNSAAPFPGSTAPETLRAVVQALRRLGCRGITLVERSGMGATSEVWRELGVPALLRDLGVASLAIESLEPSRWRREELTGSHWRHGVEVPDFLTREACVVQICNLKTHRFGGVFSAGLKNSVGFVAKRGSVNGNPYNYMQELHSSPDQRLMIAEINQLYRPLLTVMDARRIFVDGGPERGRVAQPDAVLASADRIALDVAGLALLRLYGASRALGPGGIFEQDQIRRAVELGLGVRLAKEIQFVAADEGSQRLVYQLNANLMEPIEPEKDAKTEKPSKP